MKDSQVAELPTGQRQPMPVLHWQSGLYALAVIVGAFVTPAIVFCKVLPLLQIAGAIAATTLLAALALFVASRRAERRDIRDARADHFLQASIFVAAAGLLWTHVVLQDGPWRERTIELRAGLVIAIACAVGGAILMRRRQARLAAARDVGA